jgi:hypothetical protein
MLARGLRTNHRHSDPFVFLPVVIEALKAADVSCRLCSVRMINRTGLVSNLCPTCFEERCAKCGDEVFLEGGGLAPGVKVARAGSWKCAKCAGSKSRKREVKCA